MITGKVNPLTVEELEKILNDVPKRFITVMKTPEMESVSPILSSQPIRVNKTESGFDLIYNGDYNGVFFGFNED